MLRQFILSLVAVLALFVLAKTTTARSPETHILQSPSGDIELEFHLSPTQRPLYSVSAYGQPVLQPSALGFELKDAPPLRDSFEVIDSQRDSHDETWKPVWGTDSQIRNAYNQLSISLQETLNPNRQLELVFRVYDDGVAFRYRLPRQPNLTDFQIVSEDTTFHFAEDFNSWWIPANYDSYERIYENTPLSEIANREMRDPGTGEGELQFASYAEPRAVNTPITLEKPDGSLYMAVHEADLTDYAGMTLKAEANKPLTFHSHLVPWDDGIKVKASTPHVTPWRTLFIAQTPGELIESHLLLNLNAPSKLENTSWIEPMKYIGIWWGMHIGKYSWQLAGDTPHGATTERTKRYIDFAADHNIEGVLVEGWNTGWESWGNANAFDFLTEYPDFDLEEVVRYANEKGVELMGHHETGGDVVTYDAQMNKALKRYSELGVKVVKTGYADNIRPRGQHHHGQFMVNHYRDVVKLAADYQIAINAHEPIKGTGIERTYPNMMTREGVRGMEWNSSRERPGNPPEHTVTLPFTRMLAGPLDYTPGIFQLTDYQADFPENRVSTTLSKQLANMVILYSPLQMASDLPENYEGHPAFEFVERLVTDWDESRVLNAKIAEYITIARRHDKTWYLGSSTDSTARSLSIPLDFLDDGTYLASIFEDTPDADFLENPQAYQINRYLVTAEDVLTANLGRSGGQAVILEPATEQMQEQFSPLPPQ